MEPCDLFTGLPLLGPFSFYHVFPFGKAFPSKKSSSSPIC